MVTKTVWLRLPAGQAAELTRVSKLHGESVNELVRRALEMAGYGPAEVVRPGRPKGVKT